MSRNPDSRRLRTAAGVLLGLGVALSSMPASAQSAADASLLAGSCFNCHGTDGRSPGPIVSIAGRPEAELSMKLKAFRADPAPAGTTVMNRIAKGYSEVELEALAKYFARVKAQPAPRVAASKGEKK